jgi:hypothetical protein
LARNDDESSDLAALPFDVDFYGKSYDKVYVNNNGNITFDEALPDYVPFDLTRTDRVIIAPFFADVDTRPSDGGSVTYGDTTYDGREAFCVTWNDVGYYDQMTDRRNSFQLLLVRRSPASSDFDVVFRYSRVEWDLGSASEDIPAYAGFSNGDPAKSVQVAGSGQHDAFPDGGPYSLVSGSVNSGSPGTWVFRVSGGTSGNDPRNVPPGVDRATAWWDFPDGDDDGLPDYWETAGVWVGDRHVDLAGLGAKPGRRDAFVYVDVVEGERWNDNIEGLLRSSFAASPLNVALHIVRGPRQLPRSVVPQPITASGVDGHNLFAALVRQGFEDTGLSGSPGSVPALAKYVCSCPDHADIPGVGPGSSIGGDANGIRADHLLLTMYESKWIDAVERQTGVRFPNDDEVSDRLNAVTTMHELGHLYGLRHHGAENLPARDPGYLSIMSYAYSAFGVPVPAPVAIGSRDLLPRIDYSRDDAVNYDWRTGTGAGTLSFVTGQNGERGDFYNTVAEIEDGDEGLPPEAGIDELLQDPDTRASLGDGARALEAGLDRIKPRARIRRVRIGRLRGKGRTRRAKVTFQFSASDNLTQRARLSIRCRVDRHPLRSCSRSPNSQRLARGKHRFTLQVVDGNGNSQTTSKRFRVSK